MKIVTSKIGVVLLAGYLTAGGGIVLLGWFAISTYIVTGQINYLAAMICPVVAIAVLDLPYRMQVTTETIMHQSILRKTQYPLDSCLNVKTRSTNYSEPLLAFTTKEGKYFEVKSVPFGNHLELGRAALEAAWLHNPNLEIAQEVIRWYGHPPFGIFSKRSNS
jgi:hypothetical protein